MSVFGLAQLSLQDWSWDGAVDIDLVGVVPPIAVTVQVVFTSTTVRVASRAVALLCCRDIGLGGEVRGESDDQVVSVSVESLCST